MAQLNDLPFPDLGSSTSLNDIHEHLTHVHQLPIDGTVLSAWDGAERRRMKHPLINGSIHTNVIQLLQTTDRRTHSLRSVGFLIDPGLLLTQVHSG
jgi:hypothetical protein